MTRLRYMTENGRLLSRKFLVQNKWTHITLTPDSLTYSILTEDGDVLAQGNANTLNSLKKKAKQVATELGASFFQEIRNRGKFEKLEV